MSKMTDYQSGREDGMLLAEQLVKDGGLERLREEIKYRGITGVHTQLAKKRAGESFRTDQDEHTGYSAFIGSINNP